jgi:elongation factor 1-alpha
VYNHQALTTLLILVHSPLRLSFLPILQVGKETGGKKLEEPHSLKANEMAEVVFEPCQPLVVDSFKSCEGLSRIAFLDGNTAVMLGKVVTVTHK